MLNLHRQVEGHRVFRQRPHHLRRPQELSRRRLDFLDQVCLNLRQNRQMHYRPPNHQVTQSTDYYRKNRRRPHLMLVRQRQLKNLPLYHLAAYLQIHLDFLVQLHLRHQL
jgi:hypothetical protein